jgi:CRISPR-associated protein (TIGR03986 family)
MHWKEGIRVSRPGKRNRQRNGNNGRSQTQAKNSELLKKVCLPYQFIPFAEDENRRPRYYVPYRKEIGFEADQLPRHDVRRGYSGTIEYEIRSCSPLAIETRCMWKDNAKTEERFLSGSQIRGLVRSNAEILSHSVPEFVNKGELLFRNFAIPQVSKEYRCKLLALTRTNALKIDAASEVIPSRNGDEKISKLVRVGYLTKEGNRFFVIPASPAIDDKGQRSYFKTIKEHDLIKQCPNFPCRNRLFRWEAGQVDVLINRDKKIRELTERIKQEDIDRAKFSDIFRKFGYIRLNKQLKEYLKQNASYVEVSDDEVKKYRILACDRKYRFLCKKRLELLGELKKVDEAKKAKDDFFELYTLRWMLKIERALYYEELCKNTLYVPYELKCTNKNEYLYNSSRSGTKNTHYIIKTPDYTKLDEIMEVPDRLVNEYNESLKRFRFPDVAKISEEKVKEYKNFYDIFNEDNGWGEHGKIVFYLVDEMNRIIAIGRTPYLKVPVNHSVQDLLVSPEMKSRLQARLDYARAMFGFVTDMTEEHYNATLTAYKSRVRFEPARLEVSQTPEEKEFMLLSPMISAEGMYLKQYSKWTKAKQRYSNPVHKKPSLRGRKYYLVRQDVVKKTVPDKLDNKNVKITKQVYSGQELVLKGRIHFNGLSADELGLILLSTDIGRISKLEREYKELQTVHRLINANLYELIGGAKPYGYGKVRMKITRLSLEPSDASFEALMGWNNAEQDQEQLISDAIKAFITNMQSFDSNYLRSETFQHYLLSKTEYRGEKITEWTDLGTDREENGKNRNNGNKGGGYPDNWILGDRPITRFE